MQQSSVAGGVFWRRLARWAGAALLLAAAFGAGWRLHSRPAGAGSVAPLSSDGTRCRLGPWGEMEFLPIRIAAPEELLPVQLLEETPTRWVFGNCTRAELAQLLVECNLPANLRELLLAPAALVVESNKVIVTPPRQVLLEMPAGCRQALCKYLYGAAENQNRSVLLIPQSILDKNFHLFGVTASTRALLREVSAPNGDSWFITGISEVLAQIPFHEEKVRLLKALSSHQTYLLRLHIHPESDIGALVHYWGRGWWTADVKVFLDSLADRPTGTWLDIIELLPPVPTALLYTFPVPQNPLNGPVHVHDCLWTSMNFFRDVADDRFADPAYVLESLRTDYYPVLADRRYGDVVLFLRPDTTVAHAAVYLADDFVYTKNGYSDITPWMIARIPDLLEHYSYESNHGQPLAISCFRNKNY